jgi:hypothetical protein
MLIHFHNSNDSMYYISSHDLRTITMLKFPPNIYQEDVIIDNPYF